MRTMKEGLPTCNIMEPNLPKKRRLMSRRDDEDVPVAELECIPNEIIYLICQWLPLRSKLYLRHVSRKFYYLLNDSSLWKCVAIDQVECKNLKFVKGVLKFLKPFVTTLAVTGFPHPPSSLVAKLTPCQQVKSLSLVGTSFPYSALETIINRISHLSRLVISWPPCRSDAPHRLSFYRYEEVLKLLTRSMEQVVIIATTDILFTPRHLVPFTFNVPNIAILCNHQSYSSLKPTCDFPNYDAVMTVYPRAQLDSRIRFTPSLSVTNCATRLSVEGISHPITLVKAVSTSIINSSYLYYHITSFDDRIVTNVNGPATRLTKDIGSTVTSLDCGLDNIDVFNNIIRYTPNLIVLNLNTVSDGTHCMPLDEVFSVLSVYCKGIQHIHCTLCDESGCAEVGDMDKLWESIMSLKQLKHLSICSCFFMPTQLQQAVQGARSSTGRVSRMIEIAKAFKPNLKCLPHTLNSLNVLACKSKGAYPLQDILTIVSEVVSLRCLKVSAEQFVGSSMISMHVLQNCENLKEFSLNSLSDTIFVQYDPVVIQRLQHLTLLHVSVPSTFFADLVPLDGPNRCLETLILKVDNLPHDLSTMVKNCCKLVSCQIFFQKGIAYSSAINQAKSDFKTNCPLWFVLKKKSTQRVIATHSTDLLLYRRD